MTPELYERAAAIFHMAEGLGAAEREKVLERECGGDGEIRRAVEELLGETGDKGDVFAESRLGPRGSGGVAAVAAEVRRIVTGGEAGHAPMPEWIGQYRVERVIGEGGMGRVYEAWQESPRRRVAIKVVRPELDSPEVARRFAQEAEILGALRHPAIAQIYEAASFKDQTAGGRARRFLAMEFVEGRPLVAYADAKGLGTRERVALLAAVCDGVEHAHVHGVVHRDLKPSNILVDDAGRPRVLDFGVARLVGDAGGGGGAGAMTVMTQSGQAIGTVAYMSPEQISTVSGAVDARTDVWALGVIAHELLAGRPPYVVAGVSLVEAARRISEQEPTKLSATRRELKGDVETIVGKCLEKDPARRYATAGALAADLRRYLADEPVMARPPSAAYQFSKFARRHRGLVAGVGVGAAALVGGAGVAGWQAYAATRARGEAQREAARAASVAEVLFEAFTSPISTRGHGQNVTVREALEDSVDRIEKKEYDHPPTPDAEAVVRHALGMVYRDEGRYEDAERECRKSLELRRANLPPDHPQVAAGARALAIVLRQEGRAAEAVPLYREEMAILRKSGTRGEMAQCEHNLASALIGIQGPEAASAWAEADRLLDESVPLQKEVHGADSDQAGMELMLRARLRGHQGREADALGAMNEGIAIMRRSHPEGHPNLAIGLNDLGKLQMKAGKPKEAEPVLREALAMMESFFKDPQHPFIVTVQENLAECLRMQGRGAEADAVLPREPEEKPGDGK